MEAEFDKLANNYEEWHQESINASGLSINYFYEYKIKEIHRILSKRKIKLPSSILDFGCGIGNVDPYIRKYFPESQIYGVDISKESIEIAKEKQKALNIHYEPLDENWKAFDANEESLLKKTFDLVFAANVFHHVPREEHKAVLAYIGAHMDYNSLLFIFDFNPFNPASRAVFNKFDRAVDRNANLIYPHYLKKQMKECHFQILLRSFTVFFPKPMEVLIPLEKYMTWIPMGAHYYLMASLATEDEKSSSR